MTAHRRARSQQPPVLRSRGLPVYARSNGLRAEEGRSSQRDETVPLRDVADQADAGFRDDVARQRTRMSGHHANFENVRPFAENTFGGAPNSARRAAIKQSLTGMGGAFARRYTFFKTTYTDNVKLWPGVPLTPWPRSRTVGSLPNRGEREGCLKSSTTKKHMKTSSWHC